MRPPRPNLAEFAPLPDEEAPLVSIIVPARDEAGNIGRCVGSLLRSGYPRFEVIVVDDRSTDGTADIVAGLAARDPRVRLVRGAELPDEWYGKPWACWQGFEQSRGELILFTDADTEHSAKLLPRAVSAMRRHQAELLTVLPRQEMIGFWERVVQPFFFLILGMRYGSIERINRNRNPRHGIANGQFILVTRESYLAVDGHRALRHTVIEDLMMGVNYIKAGRRHLAALAEEDMATRMYSTLPGMVEGWSKNFFMGAYYTMGSVPLAYVGMLGALTLPAWFLVPTAAVAAGLVRHNAALTVFGLVAYGGFSLFIGLFQRAARAPMIYGVLHPLGALIQAFIILRSAIRGPRRIVWKGRSYSHA